MHTYTTYIVQLAVMCVCERERASKTTFVYRTDRPKEIQTHRQTDISEYIFNSSRRKEKLTAGDIADNLGNEKEKRKGTYFAETKSSFCAVRISVIHLRPDVVK